MPDARARRVSVRVLVFARAPRPGRVKTRLIPALGADAACEVHCRLVERTLALARGSGARVELWLDGDAGDARVRGWARRYDVEVRRQRGADLGERMHRAVRRSLARGEAALLLGADCVSLSRWDLRAACAALQVVDAVLGPARDGGYVLLGLRRDVPSLFRRMPWGTRHVLALTRQRLSAGRVRARQLRWQHDLDRPRDLAYARDLAQDPALPSMSAGTSARSGGA